jgi:glycosyltransferase involved in cell wall biosynthesis
MGRGGLLLHPDVEGMTDGSEWRSGSPVWRSGEHLLTWPAGDWDALADRIDWALSNPQDRREIAYAGRAHTLKHHTYEVRALQLRELLTK